TRRSGGEPRGLEPALEGTFRGPGPVGELLAQEHADQPGAPGGVVPAELAGELPPVRGCPGGSPFGGGGSRCDPVAPVGADAAAEAADGAGRESDVAGEGSDGGGLLEAVEELLADGERYRSRHGGILPVWAGQVTETGILNSAGGRPAKPGVGITGR